jgi:rsbT co-antagonist protein RsbR
MARTNTSFAELVAAHESEILQEWIKHQRSAKGGAFDERQGDEHSREFLRLFHSALMEGSDDLNSSTWSKVRDLLSSISSTRANQGYTPSQTATFVFSLKHPLFGLIRRVFGDDPEGGLQKIREVNLLLDKLGLYTTELYQKSREEMIARQHEELLELSTPVVQLWGGILALPLIGTLDSARTQIVMQNLLEAIVRTGADIAIIDITGVPTVDTLVAQHLLKTVAAARLMGADCIISGIRPQIAQTIVHLGVDLQNVVTKATLADAFTTALGRLNLTISNSSAPKAGV